MISTGQVFHIGAAAYYVIISHMMSENMLRQKEEVLKDPMVDALIRYASRYLTRWTFVLQFIFFFIALGEDIIFMFKGKENLKMKVSKTKNYFFTVLSAPMAFIVSIVFWTFWMIDRELILPSKLDVVIPPWVNHSLHSTTSVLVLIEMYLFHHRYPKFKSALQGITLFFILYAFCILGTYYESGAWLYPFIKHLSWTERFITGLAVYAFAVAVYGSQYFLNQMLWGDQHEVQKLSKKKHKKH